MITERLEITRAGIIRAAEIIKSGGLVAFPTETVYGLGANALDERAVKKIYEAKGRPSDNPMIVHIGDVRDLSKIAALDKCTDARKNEILLLAESFWPGPLTMVLPKLDTVPHVTTGGLSTVAVRLPAGRVARRLIQAAECPIAAPSANISGRPSPTTASHTYDDMDGRIDAILWGDDCDVGIESTVIDMSGDVPTILRPGVITEEDFIRVLNNEVNTDPALKIDTKEESSSNLLKKFSPKAPGMKYKHYAPNADMVIFRGNKNRAEEMANEEAKRLKAEGKRVRVIVYETSQEAAHNLFRHLREADKEAVDVILAVAVDSRGIGFSVMNRMLKSAGYNIKEV